jgi:PhzF family phenazine biosynthesis protein
MRFLVIEVFTDTPGHGNPAGVVIADGPVADAAQRAWAERERKPGNGFLWPATGGGWNARFHTPGREVGLSGHTALASGQAVMPVGARRVAHHSRTAELEIEREDGKLWLTLPRPKLEPFDAPFTRIAHALGGKVPPGGYQGTLKIDSR